ncbi:PP2C family protein-serine/threonine phosphatase [Aerosticca soli]|uniref:Protein serine/threonine phosphatase PrpC, regulation of stationary phase n=1 Tax=Aerosticca soli TaxID=2010829 RepID=A0A2Z6E4B9_9GAMM|nr:PP2C family serine/threonine-protein phosphatase [Aerosticca soli]BBD79843.1 protein serine/threonine phosphatase PrpC, regulation of stationary phase [Aerosticca soli]
MIEYGHGTHAGLRRTDNEDTYYADAGSGLFLIADGIGGYRQGALAAALARDAVVEGIGRGEDLFAAVQAAHRHLLELAKARDVLPLGATLAALRITDGHYQAAWVGDSQLYRWRQGLDRIVHDAHYAAERCPALGTEPERPPQRRNAATQALGMPRREPLQIGLARGDAMPGSGFLLCSDGLVDALDEAALARIMGRTELAAQECVDHLLLDALAGDAADNLSAIVLRIS